MNMTLTERMEWIEGWLEAHEDSVAEAKSERAAFGDSWPGSGDMLRQFANYSMELQRLTYLHRRIEAQRVARVAEATGANYVAVVTLKEI